MQQSVQVKQIDEYRIAPTFQPSVTASAVNRYKMVIRPLSFTPERASYSFRSPGTGTLMSPNVFIEADFKVWIPGKWDYASAVGPIVGPQLYMGNNAEAVDETFNVAPRPKICFGECDAMGSAIDNIQVTVNGTSISNARLRDYKYSLDRTWYETDLIQKRFGSAGGCPQMYDSKPVSGETYYRSSAHDALVTHAGAGAIRASAAAGQGTDHDVPLCSNAATTPAVVAFTGDSGIQRRTEALLGCQYKFLPVTDGMIAAAQGPGPFGATAGTQWDIRYVRVRWALNGEGGLFSPVCPQDKLSVCCPYRNSALAIPHMNSITIDILFTDLVETLFRNLSTRLPGADQVNYLAGAQTGGVRVELLGGSGVAGEQSPRLLVEYLRMPSYKALPASVNLQVYRCSVHNPTTKVAAGVIANIADAVTRPGVGILTTALPCVGADRFFGERTASAGDKTLTCDWDGVVSAQPASYLFFTFEKSSKMYCGVGSAANSGDAITKPIQDWNYAAGAASALGDNRGVKAGLMNYFLSRNTKSCASIRTFELEIMSSLGCYTVAGDTKPFLRTRAELYRDHIRYCPEKYMDQETWYKHNCCFMVGIDQYARGLCTNGEAFPVSYKARIVFECARQFITGEGACAIGSVGPSVQRDVIHGSPVMVMIFDNSSLQISPSASLLSSQNLSHSQSMSLLAASS